MDTAWSKDACGRLKNFDGPNQVLDGHGIQYGIETRIRERQLWIEVEVLPGELVEARVLFELGFVHSESGDAGKAHFRRQVGDPGGHQVEDFIFFVQQFPRRGSPRDLT